MGSYDNRHPGKVESNIIKPSQTSVAACLAAYIYIVKEAFYVSSVLGEETAVVSFTFDLTRLHNDFVRLWLDH